jgi:cytochrome c oxidase subunit 4
MTNVAAQETHRESALRYGIVYLALLVLTASTYLISRVDLGIWSFVIAIVIAIAKASLVVLVFMQLWEHKGSYRLALATATLWVLLLMFFVVADVRTRFSLTNPSGAPPIADPSAGSAAPQTEPGHTPPVDRQTRP